MKTSAPLVGLTCLGLLFGLSAGPAQATFPGANGRIAYTWSRGGQGDTGPNPRRVGVISVRPDGSGRRLLARGGSAPRYSPDGRRIAFRRSHRLWVARADTGEGARPVTPPGWSVWDYDWSPGGTSLAFTRESRTTVKSALYTVRLDGTRLRRLQVSLQGLRLYPGAWSPNGQAIVFEQYRINAASFVRVHRAGRTTTLARGGEATWSRHGLIAYTTWALRGTPNQVCLIRPEPAPPVRCFDSATSPVWSPDGGRLKLASGPQAGPAEIWTVRPDGTVLTRTPSDAFPIFSPDGRWFAFSVIRYGGNPRLAYTDLYTMRLDGSGRHRIVRGGQAAGPDWQRLTPR